MFSWELDKIMRDSNYTLSRKDYLNINPNTCNQICRIKYDPFKDSFEIWTDDGYYWQFRVEEE